MKSEYHDELSERRATIRRARCLVSYRDLRRDLTVVVNVEQYRWLGEIELALACRTWGELRSTAPSDIFLEILDFAGFGELADELYPFVQDGESLAALSGRIASWETRNLRELPSGTDTFRGRELDPVIGGVYPPDPWMLMSESLGRPMFEWYQRNWRIAHEAGKGDLHVVARLVAELERVGYSIDRGTDPSGVRLGDSAVG